MKHFFLIIAMALSFTSQAQTIANPNSHTAYNSGTYQISETTNVEEHVSYSISANKHMVTIVTGGTSRNIEVLNTAIIDSDQGTAYAYECAYDMVIVIVDAVKPELDCASIAFGKTGNMMMLGHNLYGLQLVFAGFKLAE